MNFMGSRQGLYDEEDAKGQVFFSQSSSSSSPSSSSSSHQHPTLVPFTYNQYQQHPRGWLDMNNQDARCYTGGRGGAAQLQLVMDSSHGNKDGGEADDSDDHVLRLGDSSDTLGGGGTSVGSMVMEKEQMFDKVVTPSDVGKLNRLVIPKQHAEKYFPLDSSANEKGLLLNFEDRNGKPWRFRYSYWNSSQSYVMTKGWSRFVKEKKLHAGDAVSFQRGVGELGKGRLFIDWRRRPDPSEVPPSRPTHSLPHHFSFHRSVPPWNPLFVQPPQASPTDHSPFHQSLPNSYGYGNGPYSYNSLTNPCSGSVIYLRSAAAATAAAPQQVGGMVQRDGSWVEPMVFESVPVVHGKAAAKRLRLFGVNMECPISESDECDILSSTAITHSTMAPQPTHLSSSTIPSLQLRPYNLTPLPTIPSNLLNKGKSSMPLDFDI